MRLFSRGEPFMDTKAEVWVPDKSCLEEMESDLEAHGPFRVFSEGHLYPRLGKEDARFVLSVAEEYEHLIAVLGSEEARRLLALPKPKRKRKP